MRQQLGAVSQTQEVSEGCDTKKSYMGVMMQDLMNEWLELVNTLGVTDDVEVHSPQHALEGALCIRCDPPKVVGGVVVPW